MIHDHQLMVFPKQLRNSPHSSGVSFMFIHWHFLSRRSTSSISLYVVSIRLLPLSERLLQDERKANTHTTAERERERKTNGISVFLLSNADDVRVEEMRRCPRERTISPFHQQVQLLDRTHARLLFVYEPDQQPRRVGCKL